MTLTKLTEATAESAKNQNFDPEYFPEKPTIIDAGARYGDFCIPFKKTFPKSRIICLDHNLDIFKNKDFILLEKLLWYKKTNKYFYIWNNPQDSVFPIYPSEKMPEHRKKEYKKRTTIETITLEELINKYGNINLLKMNIEGSEFPIIEKTDKKIFEKIDQITVETHAGYQKKYSWEYMLNLLDQKNFDAHIVKTFDWEQCIIYAKNRRLK